MITSVGNRGVAESTPSSLSASTSLDPHPTKTKATKPIINAFAKPFREIPASSASVTQAQPKASSAIHGSAALTAEGS